MSVRPLIVSVPRNRVSSRHSAHNLFYIYQIDTTISRATKHQGIEAGEHTLLSSGEAAKFDVGDILIHSLPFSS
jgi:hypothetical protein